MTGAPLCQHELRIVSVRDIERGEKDLMEGINYEMRCYHPFGAVRVLAGEVESFLNNTHESFWHAPIHDLRERALHVAQTAVLFSDVPFLFPPGQIAFAAVAICMKNPNYPDSCGTLPRTLRAYLRNRFTRKSESELNSFECRVATIVDTLAERPMPVSGYVSVGGVSPPSEDGVAEQVEDLRRVLFKVSQLRAPPRSPRSSICISPRPSFIHHNSVTIAAAAKTCAAVRGGKRKLQTADYSISPVSRFSKVAKVTPTKP